VFGCRGVLALLYLLMFGPLEVVPLAMVMMTLVLMINKMEVIVACGGIAVAAFVVLRTPGLPLVVIHGRVGSGPRLHGLVRPVLVLLWLLLRSRLYIEVVMMLLLCVPIFFPKPRLVVEISSVQVLVHFVPFFLVIVIMLVLFWLDRSRTWIVRVFLSLGFLVVVMVALGIVALVLEPLQVLVELILGLFVTTVLFRSCRACRPGLWLVQALLFTFLTAPLVALLVFHLLVSLVVLPPGAGLPRCQQCGFLFLRFQTFFSDLCLLCLSFLFRHWLVPRLEPRSLQIPFVSMVFTYIETT